MASYLNSNDLKTKFVLLRHCFEIHIAIQSPIGPGVHCQILQTRSASGVERGWWVGMGEAWAFGWTLIIRFVEWALDIKFVYGVGLKLFDLLNGL